MGIWEKAQRSVAVGFISAVLAEVPKFLLLKLKLESRRFIHIASDDTAGRKRQLQKWRAVDCIAWICGIGYCVISVLFCAAFVANVSQEASTQWLISNAISLVKKAVLEPILAALCIAAMCSMYQYQKENEVHAIIRNEFFCQAKSADDVGSPQSTHCRPLNPLAHSLSSSSVIHKSKELWRAIGHAVTGVRSRRSLTDTALPVLVAEGDKEVSVLPTLLKSHSMTTPSYTFDADASKLSSNVKKDAFVLPGASGAKSLPGMVSCNTPDDLAVVPVLPLRSTMPSGTPILHFSKIVDGPQPKPLPSKTQSGTPNLQVSKIVDGPQPNSRWQGQGKLCLPGEPEDVHSPAGQEPDPEDIPNEEHGNSPFSREEILV